MQMTEPSLTFRPYNGPEDVPRLVAVYDACRPVDGLETPLSVEEMARSFTRLGCCDPRQDTLLAEAAGETVGYARCGWYRQQDGTTVHVLAGQVAPAWRGRGIGRALLRWTEDRQAAVAEQQAETGPHLFHAETQDSVQGAAALLLAAGYAVARRYYLMTRPLAGEIPPAPLPAGLEVRPVTAEQLPRIWDADVEAFRDHWGIAEPSAAAYEEWRADPMAMTPELWQVAWDGDEVAGQVRSFINHSENAEQGRLRGYTEFISVRRPWRRRGLAHALILRSLRILQAQGMTEAALRVDSENTSGALRLYERCGFRPVQSASVYRKSFAAGLTSPSTRARPARSSG